MIPNVELRFLVGEGVMWKIAVLGSILHSSLPLLLVNLILFHQVQGLLAEFPGLHSNELDDLIFLGGKVKSHRVDKSWIGKFEVVLHVKIQYEPVVQIRQHRDIKVVHVFRRRRKLLRNISEVFILGYRFLYLSVLLVNVTDERLGLGARRLEVADVRAEEVFDLLSDELLHSILIKIFISINLK